MTRYLVTGGAGFVGSHVVDALLARGNDVFVIDDLSTGRLENLEKSRADRRLRIARASIADELVLDRIMSQVDVVIHLAAAVGVRLVIEHPVRTIETNVMATEAVLKSALRYGCKVLVASTSEVYGKGVAFPFREGDDVLLGPSDKSRWGYAASKLIDEFLAFAYVREYQLPVVLFRLFNTVGARQRGHYGMVIPRFVRQALRGEALSVYGDGRQRRCFCDVEDVVAAILGLADHPEAVGQLFNIGSDQEISIRDLAAQVIAQTGSASTIAYVPYEQAYGAGFEDMERRIPHTSKLRSLLGWTPRVPLTQTLLKVRAWLEANPTE